MKLGTIDTVYNTNTAQLWEPGSCIITDHFTRYALAYPSKTQTAQATARILWDNFICHYGFPEKFISDQGRNFESDLIKELCKIAGVKKLHTTPYHPQGNGQCERFNSTLCNMLGILSEEEKSDWKSYLGCMTLPTAVLSMSLLHILLTS